MSQAYLYRPIAFYDGKVLKCAGMASDVSRQIAQEHSDKGEDGYLPGVIETTEYRGDRIHADTHIEFFGI